jgi:hypothetical protein
MSIVIGLLAYLGRGLIVLAFRLIKATWILIPVAVPLFLLGFFCVCFTLLLATALDVPTKEIDP